MKAVLNLYNGRGRVVDEMEYSEYNNSVHTILADNEFDGTKVNVTAKDEHVPEVERQIRVIKERARAVIRLYHTRTYRRRSGLD
jgi:hypothetical protein